MTTAPSSHVQMKPNHQNPNCTKILHLMLLQSNTYPPWTKVRRRIRLCSSRKPTEAWSIPCQRINPQIQPRTLLLATPTRSRRSKIIRLPSTPHLAVTPDFRSRQQSDRPRITQGLILDGTHAATPPYPPPPPQARSSRPHTASGRMAFWLLPPAAVAARTGMRSCPLTAASSAGANQPTSAALGHR